MSDHIITSKTKHHTGVFLAKKQNGEIYYRASLTFRRKHISLGSYSSEDEAHQAYLYGTLLLNNSDMTILRYKKNAPLSFEKWVSLINFRDNNIYFSNPIYMGQKLFYYYLTPHHILKFDLDDLFYYSSHKIMQRGGHYFVSDYGMQVNIANRYGIKNYAVINQDYRFINGDNTDFRRENIVILNTYHGVKKSRQKNGQQIYTVRIHIVGNYIVGHYATEIEAAIAYNKAIDFLKKAGVTKNYTPNYIEGLSPKSYVEIYSQLALSPRLLAYKPQL